MSFKNIHFIDIFASQPLHTPRETSKEMDWISLIQTLGGLLSGLGIGMFTKEGRVRSQADAYKAMAEAYETRITALHQITDNYNKTMLEQSETIAKLNRALDDKTAYIREIIAKNLDTEAQLNTINRRLSALIEQKGRLELLVEYLKSWRCEWPECHDPRGRRPPNDKLRNQTFSPPVPYTESPTLQLLKMPLSHDSGIPDSKL